MKNKLGGKLRLMVSGAAPWSEEVEEFLRVTCCCFVLQAYGNGKFSPPVSSAVDLVREMLYEPYFSALCRIDRDLWTVHNLLP